VLNLTNLLLQSIEIMNVKGHLTEVGFAEIQQIKAGMN
jgi:hypothetical protein